MTENGDGSGHGDARPGVEPLPLESEHCRLIPGPRFTVLGTIGPIAILLARVSGVRILEKGMLDRKPDYADYVRRTRSFVPWIPKR